MLFVPAFSRRKRSWASTYRIHHWPGLRSNTPRALADSRARGAWGCPSMDNVCVLIVCLPSSAGVRRACPIRASDAQTPSRPIFPAAGERYAGPVPLQLRWFCSYLPSNLTLGYLTIEKRADSSRLVKAIVRWLKAQLQECEKLFDSHSGVPDERAKRADGKLFVLRN
jgi:hypothetical protein